MSLHAKVGCLLIAVAFVIALWGSRNYPLRREDPNPHTPKENFVRVATQILAWGLTIFAFVVLLP
jgi:hypothetical protein